MCPLIYLIAELVDGRREHIVRLYPCELHCLSIVLISDLLKIKTNYFSWGAECKLGLFLTAKNSTTEDLSFPLIILNAKANLESVPINCCKLLNFFLASSKWSDSHLMQSFLTFRDHEHSLMTENFMDKIWLWVIELSCSWSYILSGWPDLKSKLIQEFF